ncbi:MAG: epoxyqueuosine reductase QueH [Lachnospiraceae bacterium]|nr:epoxyqueuosine reductase QueH [Lachnospiraceae bacterium]
MNKRNYQLELDKILEKIRQGGGESVPTLFLHSCCGPCSSYVLEYLAPYFAITVFYYNPNISASEEYQHRVREQKRLIEIYNQEKKGHEIRVIEGDWQPALFYEAVKGYEDIPEGGERCFRCYELRLRETALQASKRGFDYFGTTLTISPLKNAEKLNEIGERLAEELSSDSAAQNGTESTSRETAQNGAESTSRGTAQGSLMPKWLPSDFKKKGGYQRSIELSKEYGLYRQNFCGCSFSKAERMKEV